MAIRGGHRRSPLRARLVASHAAVIVVALLIVLAVSAGWLRRAERDAQVAALADLAVPLVTEARIISRAGSTVRTRVLREQVVEELFVRQAEDMDLRILVLGTDGRVLLDSEAAASLTGQTLTPYATIITEVAQRADRQNDIEGDALLPQDRPSNEPFRDQVVYIAASGRVAESGAAPNILMLVEPPRSSGIVGRFLPPLLVALGLGLGVALATGYLISRRLAAPVTTMTKAAHAMAEGNLEQHVPTDGPGEIGDLGASFNTMSARVAASDRAQRTLLADVSHELRTPLTNVEGYTQALRDGMFATEAERQAALDTISAEAARMRALITELLELARFESGQAILNLAPVDVAALLHDAARRFTARASEGGISIHVNAPTGLTLTADAERLHRALGNLIGNALRHTPAGGEIVLSSTQTEPDRSGHLVRIDVRDTGSGIPQERLASVFDRFARDADGGDGFGLGLPITRHIVELHGGTVSLTSRLDHGTTVTMVLPIRVP